MVSAPITERLVVNMGNYSSMPDSILVEFFHPSGEEVKLIELGKIFLSNLNIGLGSGQKPFNIAVQKRSSSKNNAYYNYVQNAVPLPDGLQTTLKVENVPIPFGEICNSQKSNPQRSGIAYIQLGNAVYEVTAYITQTKNPFYIHVIAKKAAKILALQTTPKGGVIV